jgi:hypothetical protein
MSGYRFVLMAYPPNYRRENGSEITDTVNELTGERWSIRQSASLAFGGLRTRTRHATHGSSREVWESGARVGLFVWLVLLFAQAFTYGFRVSVFDGVYPPIALNNGWLLPLVAILAMTVSTRWWVALLVTAVWFVPLWAYATSPVIQTASNVQFALPLSGAVGVAWWLAVATDGRRTVGPAVGISLLVATTVVASAVAASVGGAWMVAIALAVLVVGGLIVSTADPRVATTGAVYASLFLPIGLLSGWRSDIWAFFIVFCVAFAIAAATSQLGTRHLARI